MSSNWPFKLDHVHEWAYWKSAFSKEECDLIIELGKKNLITGQVANPAKTKKYRKSKINWIQPDQKTDWIFKRLTDISQSLNDQFFKFDVEGFLEGLQFTNYKAVGSYYGKHVDKGTNTKIRKLSLSVQLTEPKKYKGGDLNLYFEDKPLPMSKEQGTLVMFPSYVLHEVTPVSKGERDSLVAWISGKNFK